MTSKSSGQQSWVDEPETSDGAVFEATGKGWNEWRSHIEAWPGHVDGHAAIAAYLDETTTIGGWWAQTVTVGFERMTGARQPYERPDGTFTAGVSRTLKVDAATLRARLLDEGERNKLFPAMATALRSKPSTKALRIDVGSGVAQFSIDTRPDGHSRVAIQHSKLPAPVEVERWKRFWTVWLDSLGDS